VVTFFGKLRLTEHEIHHLPFGRVTESPTVMTFPLVVLAALAAIGGFLGVPEALGGHNMFHHWLEPVVGAGHVAGHGEAEPFIGEYAAMGITIVGMLLSTGFAWWYYSNKYDEAAKTSEVYLSGPEAGGFTGALYRLINAKYNVDEIYDATVVRLVRYGSRDYLWPFDKFVIDGAVNIAADVVKAVGGILGWIQNGNVKRYMLAMAMGVALVIIFLVIISPALAAAIAGGS